MEQKWEKSDEKKCQTKKITKHFGWTFVKKKSNEKENNLLR